MRFLSFKRVINCFCVVYDPDTKSYLTNDYKWESEYKLAKKYISDSGKDNSISNAEIDLYKNKMFGEYLFYEGSIITENGE